MSTPKPEKPGRKGGTKYPHYSLKELQQDLMPLCSKTRPKPLSIPQIAAGIFKYSVGSVAAEIRISALRQFGLVEGKNAAIQATDVCLKAAAGSPEEKLSALRQAFLNAKPFRDAYETFRNQPTSKDKIASYAATSLEVHMDNKNDFAVKFVESAVLTELCTIQGDSITMGSWIPQELTVEEGPKREEKIMPQVPSPEAVKETKKMYGGITILIQIDSALDSNKLEEHLKLLKKYGLI